ncbi:MAG: hypothetical protein JWM09_21 [Francisellaceae bacterium]|nr:hypothetical protein [Francisellaceae bacterium]
MGLIFSRCGTAVDNAEAEIVTGAQTLAKNPAVQQGLTIAESFAKILVSNLAAYGTAIASTQLESVLQNKITPLINQGFVLPTTVSPLINDLLYNVIHPAVKQALDGSGATAAGDAALNAINGLTTQDIQNSLNTVVKNLTGITPATIPPALTATPNTVMPLTVASSLPPTSNSKISNP